MKKTWVLGLLIVCFTFPSQAQILKKLKQKVEQRVEETVTNKVADKAAKETEKSLDNILEINTTNAIGGAGFSPVETALIPESYHFDHIYKLKMTSKGDEVIMNYFLKKDADYFGMKLPETEQMFMVMDLQNEIMVMYLDSKDNKSIYASKLGDLKGDEHLEEEDEYSFKKIASKDILGYNCDGYQAENEDQVITYYVTNEAGVSFSEWNKSNKRTLPKGFDPNWIKDENSLMMQIMVEGKKNAKNNMSITCIALQKEDFNISKQEYNSLAKN